MLGETVFAGVIKDLKMRKLSWINWVGPKSNDKCLQRTRRRRRPKKKNIEGRPLLTLKKKAQCESCELSFIWGKMRTVAQETAFQATLRNCSEEARGGARIYRSFCDKGKVVANIKRLLLIKENQISQVKEFSAFLCMGRCKSLGSLKSFL